MDDDFDSETLTPMQAYRAVQRFAQMQGVLPLRLALHAALPQVLHADLLHLLRLNFVDDGRANPVAEADVLFAAFSNELGHSYFRFDPHARAQLLAELDACYPDERHQRSQQVAEFLLQHFERELGSERSGTDAMYRSWVEVERWNALAYADPDAAAEQLAQVLQQAAEPAQAAARLRVGTLAQTLAQPLVKHQRLLAYAAGVQALQADEPERALALLRRVGDDELALGGLVLPPVAQLLKVAGVPVSGSATARHATGAGDADDAWETPPQVESGAEDADLESNAAQVEAAAPPGAGAEAVDEPAPGSPSEAPATTAPPAPAEPVPRWQPGDQALPAIRDCAYTAYISYAHADDQAWFGWVGHFREELGRGLSALLRGLRLPPLHLAAEHDPTGGALPEELRSRLGQSFALIVVVNDHYVQSMWSLQELELFHVLYGDAGLRERLYVVAMSLPAMKHLESHSVWQRLTGGGAQLWMPFFDESDPSRPLDIYTAPGQVSKSFHRPFEWLRNDLVQKIKSSVAAASAPLGPAPPARARTDSGPGTAAALVPDASAESVVGSEVTGAHLYIESNRHERTLWQDIGQQLQVRWQHILQAHRLPEMQLRCSALPIDQLQARPGLDDADGVMLLWGRKSSEALVAQVNLVEQKLAPGRTIAPGLVLYLMPPNRPSEPVPAWGWPVLRWRTAEEPVSRSEYVGPGVVEEESAALDHFLRQVLQHVQRRDAASGRGGLPA